MERITVSHETLQGFKKPSSFELLVDRSVGINNVLGVSQFPLPARLLSGYLSSFELAETLAHTSYGTVVPTVRIFVPKHVSLHVNGLDRKQAEKQVEIAKDLISRLGETVFPDIPLVIEEDEPFTGKAEEVLRMVETIILDARSDTSTPDDNPVKQSIQSILESGRRRGGKRGEENALLYTAHHPFGWHDTFHPAIFKDCPMDFEINTLPPSERPFFAIRGHIREALKILNNGLLSESEQINLIINMCGTPHYLPVVDPNGTILEPTLEETADVSVKEVSQDLQKRFKAAHDSMVKENLRRARTDFDRLVTRLGGREITVFDATIIQLLSTK